MRRTQQFRPQAPAPLEERIVLSHVAPHAHPPKVPAVMKLTTPTPGHVVQGSVGNFQGQSIDQTVQAGQKVFEEITTKFSNNTTQTENRLIVPDKAAGTVTTTSTINLRNNAGYEKVVDVATAAGSTVNHAITITLPGGGTETGTKTEKIDGNTTYVKGAFTLPGGSTKTFTGTVVKNGGQSTSDMTVTSPEGFKTRVHTVVSSQSELNQSTVETSTFSDGTSTASDSNTYVLRLTPPS